MLRDLDLKFYYNSDDDDIVNDFYNKVLGECNTYKRASGFFSSSSLMHISKGLEKLLYNNGKMQLLASPRLSKEDIEAIEKGYEAKEKVIEDCLLRSFALDNSKEVDRYNLLAWLIYEDKLDVKIVSRRDFSNIGIFHEKLGIVYDGENKIAFHGSMNESETAFIDNYESINVYYSWDNRDFQRIKNIENKFDFIWNNDSPNWEAFEFPEALKRKILEIRSKDKPIIYDSNHQQNFFVNEEKKICIPDTIKLREYQVEAIKLWLENKGKGILEMATGTGKTITAISAMVKLIDQFDKNNLACGMIIIVPYKVLLEQWEEDLLMFNINCIKCYENSSLWEKQLSLKINLFNKNIFKNLFIITTNATFKSEKFQEAIRSISNDYILCIDEMHHFATEKSLELLPSNAKFKIGLSATLMNEYKNDEIEKLINYFENGIIFKFELERAIKEGYLTKYYYYPIFVQLTDAEREEYMDISFKIGKLINRKDTSEEILKNLLIKRSRLIANCENKLEKLKEMKLSIKNSKYSLFYCGDKIENDERYVDRVNKILAFDIGIKTHTFTSIENKNKREQILRRFKEGEIQSLTAIRCLDEGVDIPKLQTAFILSSGSSKKEFIQRRGRILRKSEGKEFAYIYDFMVVPTLNKDILKSLSEADLKSERSVIFRELERFKEFANLSENKMDAYAKILNIFEMYN